MSALNKVSLNNTVRPSNRHDFGHDVSTTTGFGLLYPLNFTDMLPDSKEVVKISNLIRLTPMVAPTLSRMAFKTWTGFVPVEEIFPNYDYFMTRTAKKSSQGEFVPNAMPYITIGQLTSLTLIGSKVNVWWRPRSSSPTLDDTPWVCHNNANGTYGGAIQYILPYLDVSSSKVGLQPSQIPAFDYDGPTINISHMYGSSNGWFGNDRFGSRVLVPRNGNRETGIGSDIFDATIPPDKADLIYIPNITENGANEYEVCVTFRWSQFGQNLAKLLVGAGYPLDLRACENNVYHRVSLLPLIAWYRLWFDRFGISRNRNWESTWCHKLIHEITEFNYADYTAGIKGNANDKWFDQNSSTLWSFIINELSESFFANDDYNFVSANLDSITPVSPVSGGSDNELLRLAGDLMTKIAMAKDNTDSVVDPSTSGIEFSNVNIYDIAVRGVAPAFVTNTHEGAALTASAIEVLKAATRMSNKSTIFGQNVRALMTALGYGKYCEDCKVEYVSSSTTYLDVSDVTATADTTSIAGDDTGHDLGDWAGKSVTRGDVPVISYSTKKRGWLITMAAVVPLSSYVNKADENLFNITADEQYQKEFDGKGGYEATVKGRLFSDHVYSTAQDLTGLASIFGFLPRFAGLKVKHNKLLGDFRRAEKRETYLPFTLDKVIPIAPANGDNSVNAKGEAISTFRIGFNAPAVIPVAGEKWKAYYRFGYMGHLNRIFVNSDEEGRTINDAVDEATLIWCAEGDDNFIVHSVVDEVQFSQMLPISETYVINDEESNFNSSMDRS